MLKCIGQAAAQAAPADLTTAAAETMSRQFLAPCLFTCRDSERLREAVLTAVSELAQALKRMRSDDAAVAHAQAADTFVMSQHEELLHSAIAVLQEHMGVKEIIFVVRVLPHLPVQ